jgi:hypothetical protein
MLFAALTLVDGGVAETSMTLPSVETAALGKAMQSRDRLTERCPFRCAEGSIELGLFLPPQQSFRGDTDGGSQ